MRFAVLAGCLFSLAAAHAALNIMPLRDLRAGMRGTGKTVFSGDNIEDFQVEILGVLENTGPKESLILARLSGGPLEHTGVMQGMSGSPVYIDGKLIGAVAMAFPYAKDPDRGYSSHRGNAARGYYGDYAGARALTRCFAARLRQSGLALPRRVRRPVSATPA